MNANEQVLAQIRIASPCNARWEDMEGDERMRFCRQCSKNVYNFSGMKAAEVTQLIASNEGRLCGRFYRRTDGTMLTADCPMGAERKLHPLKRILAAAAACLCFGGLSSLAQTLPGTGKKSPAPQTNQPPVVPRALMGDVCIQSTNFPAFLGKIAINPALKQTNSPPVKNGGK